MISDLNNVSHKASLAQKKRFFCEKIQFENAESMYAPLEKAANIIPNNVALRFMGRNITYNTLIQNIEIYEKALLKSNLKKADAITVALPNIPEVVYLLYAAAKAELRFSPLHPLASPEEISKAMQKTGSGIVFVLNDYAESTASACPDAKVIAISPANSLRLKKIFFSLGHPLPKEHGNLCRLSSFLKGKITVESHAPVSGYPKGCDVLLQSGGTTGIPKIIGLNHSAINNLAAKGLSVLGRDCAFNCGMLCVLPVFHGFGLAMGIHTVLCNGAKAVLFPKFNRLPAIKEIKRGNVQFIIGVPRLYEALLSHKKFGGKSLKNLIASFVGGDFVPQTLLKRFDARIAEAGGTSRLFEGYGLTETVTVCSVGTQLQNRAQTVGKPLDGIDIAAFSFEGEPQKLPYGEKGELAVSGDTLMQGYFGDESATEKVFFTYNEKKYVKTGDCGAIDNDGFVHFLSRIKRIIKVRGVPVYPLEIEQLAMTVSGVTGACVIAGKDNSGEEYPVLFAESADNNVLEQIKTLAKENLSVFSQPKDIIVMPHLPLTDMNKYDAATLKKEYFS